MGKNMVVQSVILPNSICVEEEIYFRKKGEIHFIQDQIEMRAGSCLTTDTYMNCFDAAIWHQYTGITKWKVCMKVCGSGTVKLVQCSKEQRMVISEKSFQGQSPEIQQIPFEYDGGRCLYYLEFTAFSELKIINIRFEACAEQNQKNDIRLGLIICTYHREKALSKNLNIIRKSQFFNNASELYGKLQVFVIDNGSELPLLNEEFITLYHNPNTGGSGGFTRGIEEIRKQQEKLQLSNVIFMDDDVEIIPETLYRLYNLLALIKDDYKNDVIAGRMFRMDQRNIQYTAAEIWNKGDIRHIGWNRDMTLSEELFQMNENQNAEYGGWWFCCYPISFVMENTPLPFFLHCDDVEYGLRHGGTPIILNGIQVWHETYEYRQSPVIAYYDMRNPLIVNAIYGLLPDKKTVLAEWKKKISEAHVRKDYLTEKMMIQGLFDYNKGIRWFFNVMSGKVHHNIGLTKKMARIENAILWRITEKITRHLYNKRKKQYREMYVFYLTGNEKKR